MTQQEFIKTIEDFYKDGVDIVRKKNTDYATEINPFRNFEFAALVNVSVPRAILVRMSDKLARISNVIDKEVAVKDETVTDTLLDLANYTAILMAYLKCQKKEK